MFAASKTASVSGGYQISRSLRFNSADSAYLNRTPASATNQQTWTWSGWFKRSSLSTNQAIFYQNTAPTDTGFFEFYLNTNDQMVLGGGVTYWRITTQVFRDVSAWMHMVVAVDTTQATANNRVRLYINGSEVTTFSTTNNPAQNSNTGVNGTGPMGIGRDNSGLYFNGYQTECYLIDGTQLTPSSFGETNAQTGVWQPKAYSGSYGTNGFYLNFSDNSNTTAATLGKDYSGNGNNWTPNNFSVTAGSDNDSMVDVPTPYGVDTGVGGTVRGNYCTLNPLDTNTTNFTLSNGNLTCNQFSADSLTRGTFGVSSGKWYWEATLGNTKANVGIATSAASLNSYCGSDAFGFSYYSVTGQKVNNGSLTSYGATATTGDVIGIAFDADAGTLVFYKNGTSQGTAFTGLTSGPYFPAQGTSASLQYFNFGQRPFAYTAPSGFKALCTQNLPTPTIGATTATQAGKYFAPTLYTGNGTSQTITTGFMPNLVWIKSRSNAQSHFLHNNVDNVSLYLSSNNTNAEGYDTTSVTAISSTGFSLGTESNHNGNGNTYVAWGWNASGSSGGTTNTAGSITSTVSANTTSGFSVVTYTGTGANATVGHGLGVAPSMIICKARGASSTDWAVYTQTLGIDYLLQLNLTNAAISITNKWSGTNSSVFGVNSATNVNQNTITYVAYCFAEVAGYSKFGSYTGNGSADGPFVFTGFRPAYVLIKNVTTAGFNWNILDNSRSPYNIASLLLTSNLSDAESTFETLDMLSNGFKIRRSNTALNGSGETIIYMAFAQNPFKYSLAR